ncbi:hypothetical protein FACS189413_15720 [Bacteroidia bacterium]|nr:hypothetical protein FACS189413_15720 [Bacteroidia bacterium]
MRIKITYLFTLLLICTSGHSHTIEDSQIFSIVSASDTISFFKVNSDTITPKPTVLFCQGSLPIPLFIEDSETVFIPSLGNFDYPALSNQYNFVVISMPHTPIYSNNTHLNNSFAYVPDTIFPTNYDSLYLKDNYLEKYVERGNKVIQFLKTQKWVDPNKIILMGHSQGANVGLKIASQNPDIFALGYFSGSVGGRFAKYIREERKKAKLDLQTKEETQSNINQLYTEWKKICRDSMDYGDPSHTWKSFSISFLQEMIHLKMPVYVTYGTEDSGTEDCDYLPIYFELSKKTNYAIRAFVGLGHNFEEVLPDGKSNYDNMYWDQAVKEFFNWIEKQPYVSVQ